MQKKYQRYKQKIKRKYLILSKRVLRLFSKKSKPKISHRNKVSLIPSGSLAFEALKDLIKESKKYIELEYYIIKDDDFGRELSDILIKKADENVEIKIIYDDIGSWGSKPLFNKLNMHPNIEVIPFNPIKFFSNPFRWDVRDHRKLAIFDGKKAIVSGWNIGEEYFDDSKDYMRDAGILISGPAVSILRKSFYEIYEKSGGKNYRFKEIKVEPTGNDNVWIIESGLHKKFKAIYNAYCLAMMASKKTIWIENAYFVPPKKIRKILSNAVSRGVDVKIILPDKIDVPIVKYASHKYFESLLKIGVKIFERKNLILHSKIALIDNIWVTIGSTNLHKRSLEKNYELNIVVTSEDFGNEIKKFMEEDIRDSITIDYNNWKRRPIINKIKENIAGIFAYFL